MLTQEGEVPNLGEFGGENQKEVSKEISALFGLGIQYPPDRRPGAEIYYSG
jgi:hypothetical protein